MSTGKTIPESALPSLKRDEFMALFADVFEHSPWVAERAWQQAPFSDKAALLAAMTRAMMAATDQEKLALIRAHPDLAGRAAIGGGLTDASKREQAGAGLDQCSAEEFARFQELNAAYKEKFGFPFIMAVKNSNRHQILEAFENRLANTPAREFETALGQIARIAAFRLNDIII